MQLTDTHCHLQFEDLYSKLPEVLEAAAKKDVTRIICVGTTTKDSQVSVEIAEANNCVWAAIGWHPHEAGNYFRLSDSDCEAMEKLADSKKVVAIGECGLDYHYDNSRPDEQEKILRFQIEHLALKRNLPVIFHVRDACRDFWRIIDDYKHVRGVVHSFSTGQKQLDKILDRGFYVGLNGIMTFTKDHAQLAAAKAIPLEKMLLETDAPFLTPAPRRDELCEPKHTRTTAEFLADLRQEPLEDIAATTTNNAKRLFGLS